MLCWWDTKFTENDKSIRGILEFISWPFFKVFGSSILFHNLILKEDVMLNFINQDLPPQNNGTINVKVRYLGSVPDVSVESTIDTQSVGSLQDALSKTQDGFKISRLLGYFKLKAKRELLPEEDSQVEIEIQYSLVAWDLAVEKGDPYPRVAYLPRGSKGWANDWVLFDDKHPDVEIEADDYQDGSPYRIMKIRHQQLPDPLIGSC